MLNELEELKKKAAQLKRRSRERKMERYQHARSLGFSASEAAILAGRAKKYIDHLAQEREG